MTAPNRGKNVIPGSEKDTATEVVQITRDLALELHPQLRRSLAVTLDSSLDRDLGLDSLGRAELLLRLDRHFKVRLPEELIGDAETPRDILQSVLTALPLKAQVPGRTIQEPVLLPETETPVQAATLIDVLVSHVENHADRPHIYLWGGEGEEERITYGNLDESGRAVAYGLLQRGLKFGDRVGIMLPTDKTYFAAFFGVLFAGGIPVPVYPPFRRAQVEDHLRRQACILRNAEASFLITDDEIRKVGVLLYGLVKDLRHVTTVGELSQSGKMRPPQLTSRDTTALIQYTSGSTGDPKGVVLSHANLLSNIRAMGEVMEANSADIFVSWLPLYHDMGLIGAWFGCLYFGARLVIMPPLVFLADPARWLWAIHRHRATLSASPNFAFELCLKNIRDEDIQGLDLSSLRMIANGAEPVSPATISRFNERFQKYGFRPEAMAPVYGLAECSVGLAFPPIGRVPIVDCIDRKALSEDGFARRTDPEDPTRLEFVACGRPLPGHQVRIVDEAGREVADRYQGRLQFKGPSASRHYYKNEEKTRELYQGDWLDSGDLAYISEGDIYITGRVKDMIIRAGRNIYPHELEELVGNIEGVRKGCVAAFASTDERTGSERLIILAETRLKDQSELDALRSRIIEASTDLLDMPPDEVVLGPPHAVPKTSSGKIRRSAARKVYEMGTVGQSGSALWWQLTRLIVAGFQNNVRRSVSKFSQFAYAVWWWIILALIAAILWALVILLPYEQARHTAIRHAARLFLRLTGIGLDVEMEAQVPEHRVILAINHSSYLDAAVICAAIPNDLAFVAKTELNNQIVAGTFLRRIGTIFVRRTDPKGGVEDTSEILQKAKAGERIVSFPEGTLTRMPGLLPFHLGTFLVAAQAGIPVAPVTICGTRSILRGDQWFPRRGKISVHIASSIDPEGKDFYAAVHLRNEVRKRILLQCREPDLSGEQIEL